MSNRQIQAMMRSPQKIMRFQVTGKLPRESKAPTSPLLDLIKTIPTSMWGQFIGVTVSRDLGFNGSRQFNSLHQVAHWLGHNKTLIDNERMPYQSWVIRGFSKKLTVDDLLSVCSKHPNKNSPYLKGISR